MANRPQPTCSIDQRLAGSKLRLKSWRPDIRWGLRMAGHPPSGTVTFLLTDQPDPSRVRGAADEGRRRQGAHTSVDHLRQPRAEETTAPGQGEPGKLALPDSPA